MTSITIERARGAWRFTAEGHATGAPEACTGVSALLYALAGWLRNAPAGTVTLQSALSPGRAELNFHGGAAADTAAELTAIGLAQIAARYPDAVEVLEGKDPPAARGMT